MLYFFVISITRKRIRTGCKNFFETSGNKIDDSSKFKVVQQQIHNRIKCCFFYVKLTFLPSFTSFNILTFIHKF